MSQKRHSKRSFITKSLCIVLCISLLVLLASIIKELYDRFFPSTPEQLARSFQRTRTLVHRQWERLALAAVPTALDEQIESSPSSWTNVDTYKPFEPVVNRSSTESHHEILCAVFLRAEEKSLDQLIRNVENLKSNCAWAIVAFAGDPSLFERTKLRLLHMKNTQLAMYTFARPRLDLEKRLFPDRPPNQNLAYAYNALSYPKAALYLQLEPLLLVPRYEYVWLLDDDLDLSHFRFSKFIKTVHCAFWPSPPPLAAQPLIKQALSSSSTARQVSPLRGPPPQRGGGTPSTAESPLPNYSYLQYESWERKDLEDVLAVRTVFLELQAPLLRTDFLRWFITAVVAPTLPAAHLLGADYGYDNVFCHAAAVFASRVHNTSSTATKEVSTSSSSRSKGNRQQLPQTAPPAIPCLLVTSGSPVMHMDGRSSAALLTPVDRRSLNIRMVRVLRKSYPSWFTDGHSPVNDPLLNSTSPLFRRSTRLSNQCLKS